jgi:predicted transcriptional regulator
MEDRPLEAPIMNRLQEMKGGQTVEQLAEHLKQTTTLTPVMAELYRLKKDGCVARDKNGVWTMVRV